MGNQTAEELTKQRRRKRRVARMKVTIVSFVFLSILVLLTCCVVFAIRIHMLQKQVDELTTVVALRQETQTVANQTALSGGKTEASGDAAKPAEIAVASADAVAKEEEEESKETEEDDGSHSGEYGINYHQNIYLTFDDGPSDNTDEILDILAEYNVKATFFVVGKEDEESVRLYKRIVNEGHTLAMHSYTHDYSSLYASLGSFKDEITKQRQLIYDITGYMPQFFRFPGGSSNKVSNTDMGDMIQYLNGIGMKYFDWNVSSQDATNSKSYTTKTLMDNIMNDISKYHTAVVLLHDGKDTTTAALPKLLKQLQKRDADILPITDDTPLVQHVKYDSVE
jgi:peptidoglycan/xylan/chitin deacetylase (PgdA/CDA1 family)